MKKQIIILIVMLLASFVSFSNSFAQLKRDIQYIRGVVVSVDETNKILVIRVGENKDDVKTFDISQSRLNGQLLKGQNVYVIASINSNQAKSVRILTE